MKTNRIKLLVTAIFLCLLLSLCVIASAGVSVGFDKQPLADEILVYGSVNALDDLAAAAYTNELKALDQTVITAEDLLIKVKAGDQFAVAFAGKLGLGMSPAEIESNLQKMVDEYQGHKAKGEDFTEPRFIINGVNIVLNKNIEQIRLTRNADGTYSASLNGDQTGYRGSIMIDADASITIMYDENGEAKIERRVSNGKPTDFVITLDVSGSMESNGRDHAMLSALKTVLEEILQEEKNTVSIVFWAKNGAVMQLNVDGEGVQQVFSGADGMTVQKLFDAELVNRYNDITSYSLSDATISQIENLYNLGSITEPDNGLYKAIDLLENIEQSEERNTGVMLFTDGTVVPSGRSTEKVERNTVALEKQIAEDFGATLVNVSIGDEYEVKSYGRYLNPLSDTYYDQDQILKDNVLYYNIPKLTNQELADKVSEMFEVAFIDITTETKELRTETITDGVLAAYGAQLIEKIPAGFELVEIKGETTGYEVRGTDENGNTMISFNLGEIVSGRDQVLSYCVIPTDTDHDIGVTAFTDSTDTVLYARPVNRLAYLEEEQIISITLDGYHTNQDVPHRPGIVQPEDDAELHIVAEDYKSMAMNTKLADTDEPVGTLSNKEAADLLNFLYGKTVVNKPWWWWDKWADNYFPEKDVKDFYEMLTNSCQDKSDMETDKIRREFLITAESLLTSRMNLNSDMLKKRTERLISYVFNIETKDVSPIVRKATDAKNAYETFNDDLLTELLSETEDDINPLEVIGKIYRAATGKNDLKMKIGEDGAFYVINGKGDRLLVSTEAETWSSVGSRGKTIEISKDKYSIETKTDYYSLDIEDPDFRGAEFMLDLMDAEKWDAYLNCCFTLANIVDINNAALVYEKWNILRDNTKRAESKNPYNNLIAWGENEIAALQHEVNSIHDEADVYAEQLFNVEKSLMLNGTR